MNEPKQTSPRQRLQQLLAIPERQRTDAEWDEINELEISLTPINRESVPQPGERRHGGEPSAQAKPNNGGRDRRPAKQNHKRPQKPTHAPPKRNRD